MANVIDGKEMYLDLVPRPNRYVLWGPLGIGQGPGSLANAKGTTDGGPTSEVSIESRGTTITNSCQSVDEETE